MAVTCAAQRASAPYPGCQRRHGAHVHHIRHWIHGGTTDHPNLILLCTYHHRLLHEDGYSVQRNDDGALTFKRPDGRAIPQVPRPIPTTEWQPPPLPLAA